MAHYVVVVDVASLPVTPPHSSHHGYTSFFHFSSGITAWYGQRVGHDAQHLDTAAFFQRRGRCIRVLRQRNEIRPSTKVFNANDNPQCRVVDTLTVVDR